MRSLAPAFMLLALGTACASGGKTTGGSETTVSPSTATLVNGATMGSMSINMENSATAIATPVPVSQDSAYALITRAYVMLEIPVAPVDRKRAVGNDALTIRRRIGGMPMQKVIDCGDKMGLPNAETWDIHMNILSYVEAGPNGQAQILTRIQAMGNPADISNRDLTPCSSTGDLEKKISDLVLKLASNK